MHKKRLFNLQMFAEAVQGKKVIYLFRIYDEQATENAVAMAFVTENERSKSKDADSTATKDGAIRTPGATETEISATAIIIFHIIHRKSVPAKIVRRHI